MGGSKLYYVKFDGWHRVPAETPQASHGEGTEGGSGPLSLRGFGGSSPKKI